jgi:orotidine-5'-phosphate decarboxylase
MSPDALLASIRSKRSLLCVGLDTDPRKIPAHLQDTDDPVFEFNKAIIEATSPYAVAYKPNLAFYEAQGLRGWQSLQKTLAIIPQGCLRLADAKRGDIGNTSELYARAFFEAMDFDAITVAPYMGRDSVLPFLQFPEKWVFLLALTSNPGADDFQLQAAGDELLFEKVIRTARGWAVGQPGHLGFVTGATRPVHLAQIRALAPDNFFLVPGVGAQGGDLEGVCTHGLNAQAGLLINSSRAIIYASSGRDFAQRAAIEAQALQKATEIQLQQAGICS